MVVTKLRTILFEIIDKNASSHRKLLQATVLNIKKNKSSQELKWRKFHFCIGKKLFFTARADKHQNRLLREFVASPSLGVLET